MLQPAQTSSVVLVVHGIHEVSIGTRHFYSPIVFLLSLCLLALLKMTLDYPRRLQGKPYMASQSQQCQNSSQDSFLPYVNFKYCTHHAYNIPVNSIVVYTAITGGYDNLRQPKVIDLNIDYVCFTDAVSQIQQNGIWKMMPIPKELQYLSDVKKQRVVKICPHRYLKDYDISIWVDGNFSIVGSIRQFIKQYDLNKSPLYVRVHPIRKCIYEEAKVCIEMHKDLSQTIQNQVSTYRKEGYPKNIGMAETGIVLRRHNDIKCQLVDNLWASELLKHSHRDQLSFNYACWKIHFLPGCLNKEFNVFGNKTFVWRPHGR